MFLVRMNEAGFRLVKKGEVYLARYSDKSKEFLHVWTSNGKPVGYRAHRFNKLSESDS